MKQATVIYISSETDDNGYLLGFNLMSDPTDYSDKWIKWPLELGEEFEYHNSSQVAELDNVHLISIGRISDANFHTFAWAKDVTERRFGDRLRAWRKDASTFKVDIMCPEVPPVANYDDGTFRGLRLNYFHEALEYDITYNMPGTLIWGDGAQSNTYYIGAFGIESSTSPMDNKFIDSSLNSVNFYCPIPWWKKITSVYSFDTSEEDSGEEENEFVKDYESLPSGEEGDLGGYDYYPYDYIGSKLSIIDVDNTNGLGSRYICYIWGPADLPRIEIVNAKGGNKIVLFFKDLVLNDGDCLVIDSIDKTCLVYHPDDTISNVFRYRDTTEGYLWNRIDAGKNRIKSNGGFIYRLDLVEERSEPKWPMV